MNSLQPSCGEHMKQKSFETMLNWLIGLTPDQVESLIATACDIASQKAAVGAIDRHAREATCPHCGAVNRQRLGRTRTGSQRYRCQGCLKTFNGRTGSSIAQLQKQSAVAFPFGKHGSILGDLKIFDCLYRLSQLAPFFIQNRELTI